MEDGKKYQNMILEAANREVRLQKEFTERVSVFYNIVPKIVVVFSSLTSLHNRLKQR
jgi:hypothetical protein